MLSIRRTVHQRWDEENRARLAYIVWCEKCGRTDTKRDLAHRKKRRFIGHETEEDHKEYGMVAWLCRYTCHRNLDEATGNNPHGMMFDEITKLIENRLEPDIHIA